MLNILCYTLIDLIPIGTILFLHWKNFKMEAQKEYALDKNGDNNDELAQLDKSSKTDFSIKIAKSTNVTSHDDNPDEAAVMLPFMYQPGDEV